MSAPAKIAIIILNWNGREDTLECLKSIDAIDYPNVEVIVVDNGSSDQSVESIRDQFPKVILIENGRNLGFAEGNNVGIERALASGVDFILLLNNDAVIGSKSLHAFVRGAERFPETAVFSGKIYDVAEPKRIWFAGSRWVAEEAYFDNFGLNVVDRGDDHTEPVDTDFTPGCFMFFSVGALRKLGLLDPKFFLLFEEIEWCYRARKAGYRCLYVPDAVAWHKGSVSFGGRESPLYQYFFVRNRLLWAEKHLPYGQLTRVWRRTLKEVFPVWDPSDPVGISRWKVFYWKLSGWLRRLTSEWAMPLNQAKRAGLRDYLCRRFGDCPRRIRLLHQAIGLGT